LKKYIFFQESGSTATADAVTYQMPRDRKVQIPLSFETDGCQCKMMIYSERGQTALHLCICAK